MHECTNGRIYLAGAIEASPDQGVGWRKAIIPELQKKGFTAFNPMEKTDGPLLEAIGWKKFNWEKIREPKWRKEYIKTMQTIVEEDIKELLKCDILLVYFDKYVQKGAGTYGEITLAKYKNIPVFVVLEENISFEDIPAWVIGCTDRVFKTFNSFYKHLLYGDF